MLNKYILSTITATLVSSTTLSALTLKKSVEEAILTNYEISSNNLQTQSEKLEIDIEKSAFNPTLDFDTRIESSDTRTKRDGQSGGSFEDNTDGYNLKLTLEQLIYDGGKTPSLIREKEANYKSSLYETTLSNNKIIFEVVKSYNNILKIEEINKLNALNKIAHDEALEIAYNKEEISGEVLETKKTQAMIYELNNKIYTQQVDLNKAHTEFKKLTGLEAKALCPINIDESMLPSNEKDLISLAYDNNLKIKEQNAKVKMQQEKLSQDDSNYLPTIKAKLEASHDNDIELTNKGVEDEILGEVSLKWNFYSGGKDDITTQKNILLLNKEKKNLEKIKLEVKEDISNLYKELSIIKEKIANFKLALNANKEILHITTQQLEDGTKTFIDLLLAKSKVFETQIDIITQEAQLREIYFEIQHNVSPLSETILALNDVECNNTTLDEQKVETKTEEPSTDKKEETIDSLLEEEPVIENKAIDSIAIPETPTEDLKQDEEEKEQKEILQKEEIIVKNVVVNNTFEMQLKEIYNKNNKISFDDNTLKATINITSNSFTIKAVNDKDNFKNVLDNITRELLELISKHKSNINNVIINSYTSSENKRYINQVDQDKANLGLSQRRANKVKNYFMYYALKNGLDTDMIDALFIAKGKGSQDLILDAQGDEDKVLSRRIVLEVVKK
jgi:adhesin transport system outer membrane protein